MSLTVFLTFAAFVAVSHFERDVLLQTGRAHGLKRKEDKTREKMTMIMVTTIKAKLWWCCFRWWLHNKQRRQPATFFTYKNRSYRLQCQFSLFCCQTSSVVLVCVCVFQFGATTASEWTTTKTESKVKAKNAAFLAAKQKGGNSLSLESGVKIGVA